MSSVSILTGSVASKGIVSGTIRIIESPRLRIEHQIISSGEAEDHLKRLRDASDLAIAQLQKIIEDIPVSSQDKAAIFEAHQTILRDEELISLISQHIREDRHCLPWAVEESYDEFIEILSGVEDPLIQERVSDMCDTKQRLLACCLGITLSSLAELTKPAVIVAKDLLPSDTVVMDSSLVIGIITEKGGLTSHSAIIARSYGIPSLYGIDNARKLLKNGQTVILDALEGKVITAPSDVEIAECEAKHANFIHRQEVARQYLTKKAETKDGKRISIELNIGSAEIPEDILPYVDGVGLFRTEFLYMEQKELPSEEAQFEIYRKVLETFGDRPVTIRTLDIGGDKTLPCLELPREQNPFLGNRALRLCLSRPDIFRPQLRALLRASVYGNLQIMFPMVGSLDDIRKARRWVEDIQTELREEGTPYHPDTKIGIMVEIPSIAAIADLAAKEVDFACIGTNDLCQYLCAADRMNPNVTSYYQDYHPAMFRMIHHVVKSFAQEGKSCCICGELGGDPVFSSALLGMGMTQFSMSPSAVPEMKQMVAHVDEKAAIHTAQTIRNMETSGEIHAYLSSFVTSALT